MPVARAGGRARRPSTAARRRRGRRSACGARSAAGEVVVTATSAPHPAARAARRPATESSTTRHCDASTSRRRAPSSHGSGHGFPRSTSDAVTTTGGCRSPVAAIRASARSRVPGGDDGRGHLAVGELAEQLGGPRQDEDAVDVGDLDLADPHVRGIPAVLGEHRGDDVGGRHAVHADEPVRVDPELLAPPQPGPLDGGDRVDQGAVEVEQHAVEGGVERVGGRGGDGEGRHTGQPRHRPRVGA